MCAGFESWAGVKWEVPAKAHSNIECEGEGEDWEGEEGRQRRTSVKCLREEVRTNVLGAC